MAWTFYFIWRPSQYSVQYSPIDCHILQSTQEGFHGLAILIVIEDSDVCLKQLYVN